MKKACLTKLSDGYRILFNFILGGVMKYKLVENGKRNQTIIKVVGVGGCGGNAIVLHGRMTTASLPGGDKNKRPPLRGHRFVEARRLFLII